jgi:REP-associated tyrosine transposase
MPRANRVDEGGGIYHALNRGNNREGIFLKEEDYEAFLRTLAEGLERYSVDLLCFCLLPNHWHLILRPHTDGEMGRMLRWVTATHTQRYHAHYQTSGYGHLYQARYKSFPIQDDDHFHVVCRYVERNALGAKLVKRAEAWRYGSLWRWLQKPEPDPKILTAWPLRRPPGWVQRVNEALTKKELDRLRECVQRGRPYGDEAWTEKIANRLDLWSTIRPRGRPKAK